MVKIIGDLSFLYHLLNLPNYFYDKEVLQKKMIIWWFDPVVGNVNGYL